MRKLMKAISLAVLGAICLCGCALGNSGKKEITIYTAVDQIYAEPVFEDFEKETGIKVNAVYVEKNEEVKKGQKILDLDLDNLTSQLSQLKIQKARFKIQN